MVLIFQHCFSTGYSTMLGRSIVRVSQVLRCTVFTEVAEGSAVKLITLMNMLFGFNTLDTVFIWPLALEETKDICNPINYLRFYGLLIRHFEIFSVIRSLRPVFWLPAIGAKLKQCGYVCFPQGTTTWLCPQLQWSEFHTPLWASVPEQVAQMCQREFLKGRQYASTAIAVQRGDVWAMGLVIAT